MTDQQSSSATASAHTPTPWNVEENCLGVYAITAMQGPIKVQPAKAFGQDDAAFIVKAVNAHADLVKALERIEYASRKDSLTLVERVMAIRTIVHAALSQVRP